MPVTELRFAHLITCEIAAGKRGAAMQCQWSGRKTKAAKQKGCNVRARLRARASNRKSAPINFVRRGSKRTVTKRYRSERKGRRSFHAAIEYSTVAMMAT
jgi:hypothetical protein